MNHKELTVLEAESKAVTFTTDTVDVSRDEIFGCVVVTTSQASLNVSMQLEASFDEDSWFAVGSPIVITTDTASVFTLTDNPYPFVRLTSTRTAGTATFEIKAHTKSY